MDFETIKFELREDGIGILTFNRPAQQNAVSAQFSEELNNIFDYLMINLDCRVLLLRAEGPMFCAGLDLRESPKIMKKRLPEELEKFQFLNTSDLVKRSIYYQAYMGEILIKMRRINQPIIALIQGPAAGGGFTITMAADIRIATNNAKFSIGAINIGMSGGDLGGSYFLPRLIGLSRAAEIMYTGRPLGAEEAKEIGYVHKLVKEDELFEIGINFATEMLSKSPLGLRMTKEAINMTLDSPTLYSMIKLDNRAQTICIESKDLSESMQSYFEKRKPKYPLR